MSALLVIILLAALALFSISLLKTYRHVSERELKRRARSGDEVASAIYKAAAYGDSLGAVLWFLVGISVASFFVYVSRHMAGWLAASISALLIWFAFVWMPARDVSRAGVWIAARLAPALAWILNYLHPLIDGVSRFVGKHLPVTVHTGLYDRDDLLMLLEDQQVQPDNRIEQTELDIAMHALTFGDRLVREVMVPRRAVKMVSAEETVGPVLMSELHGSGFSRFPVYAGKKDNVVGTLFIRNLVKAKAGGQISKLMHEDTAYIHEEQSLADALQAVLKTHQHLFVVVNRFEEYVGIITMEDVLEQIVGRLIIDEFDRYDDIRAVAVRAAQKEHETNQEPEKPQEPPTEETPEVVE